MRYTFFDIKDFKGIRHARVDLAPESARVYTLVGLNESGKTTVLEAIDQFQPTSAEDVSPKHLGGWVAPPPHLLIPIAERTNFNGTIEISCGIELDDSDVTAARGHLRKIDGYRLADLHREIRITDTYRYADSKFKGRSSTWDGLHGTGRTKQGRIERSFDHAHEKTRWESLATFLRGRVPTIWFFPNFLFDFPERIYIEPADGESESNRFYRSLFQDVLDALDLDLDLTKHVIARARSSEASDREHLRQLLLEAERHVTKTVVSSWNRIFADKPIAQKRVRIDLGEDPPGPGATAAGSPTMLWVRFQLEDSDGLFSIRERSLGFRWFFVYLMLTTYRGRRAGGAGGDMLFLFDEPASNLHPTAQKALLSSLSALSDEATVIYTTHSHHLIEPAWLGTTFVVANEGLGDDVISTDFTARRTDVRVTPYRQFAAQHPNQSHYFQPILDVLDYAPSRIELVPAAVMVEGKSDYYLLRYLQDVCLEFPAGDRLSLIPGGGAGTLDDLIQLYLGWSRPFIALLDSDRAGHRQRARYIEKFGPVVKPHLIDLAAASGKSDAKGIESLVAEADRLALQCVAKPGSTTYRKKDFALGVQEAWVTHTRVKLSGASTRPLRKVHATLRARLSAPMNVPSHP